MHKAVIHSPGAVAHPEQGGNWAMGNRRFCLLSILLCVVNILYRASSPLMHLSSFAKPALIKYLVRVFRPATPSAPKGTHCIFIPLCDGRPS